MYYSQSHVEECKYKVKEEALKRCIIADFTVSDYDYDFYSDWDCDSFFKDKHLEEHNINNKYCWINTSRKTKWWMNASQKKKINTS